MIPATNLETGKIEYFSNKNRDNIFEALRATKAMPILFNKEVGIKGKKYCDSHVSISTTLNALKAIELGADKLIIITNNAPNFINELFLSIWFKFRNKQFKENYLKSLEKIKEIKIPTNILVIYLQPKNKLKITMLNNNQEILKKTLLQGFNETCSNKELKKFLEIQ